jgi:hypothetical protein
MTFISEPQEGRTSGSTSEIRLISLAQLRLMARASQALARAVGEGGTATALTAASYSRPAFRRLPLDRFE